MSVNLENIVDEVSKSRYSSLGSSVSNEDISAVWDAVSAYIEQQLLNRKGVNIKNLGTFTLSISKLDIGNNQFIQIIRPVFIPSVKFLQSHGLNSSQYTLTNDTAVSPINFTSLAFETPYSRDIVERCIHEVILLMENNIRSGKIVNFLFKGIGRLIIADGRVKMRFFKEFMNQFDKSGRLVRSLRGRPNTTDSVLSNSVRPPSLPQSAIGNRASSESPGGLQPIPEVPVETIPSTHNHGEGCACSCHKHDLIDHVTAAEEAGNDIVHDVTSMEEDDVDVNAIKAEAAENSQRRNQISPIDNANIALATAEAVDFSTAKERFSQRPMSSKHYCASCARGEHVRPQPLANIGKSYTMAEIPRSLPPISSRPNSCIHTDGGQELCYICYQRSRLNQPLDLKPLRQQRDVEENRMWGEQNKLEAMRFKAEQEERAAKQQIDSEKTAAFNLGIAEAVRAAKQVHRQPEVCRSFILEKRTVTPRRDLKVVSLKDDCKRQAQEKKRDEMRQRQEEIVAGQIEQLELAKALSEDRERQERLKLKTMGEYRNALNDQLRNKSSPIPGRQPDSEDPVFGVLDGVNVPERRKNAEEVARDQLDTVAAKRRAEVLKRIQQQREEQLAQKRACSDLNVERSEQFRKAYEARRCLEDEWLQAAKEKREREKSQRLRFSSPGLLIHEQCDDYKRCVQCQRKCSNNGKSKIWTDTYYVNGSRFIM